MNDTVNARLHYEKALILNPNESIIHNAYAYLLINRFRDINNAEEHFKKAVELNPMDPKLHYNYAHLLLFLLQESNDLKDVNDIKYHLEIALGIDSTYAEANYDYSMLLTGTDGYDQEAQKYYAKAIRLKPALKNKTSDDYFR